MSISGAILSLYDDLCGLSHALVVFTNARNACYKNESHRCLSMMMMGL